MTDIAKVHTRGSAHANSIFRASGVRQRCGSSARKPYDASEDINRALAQYPELTASGTFTDAPVKVLRRVLVLCPELTFYGFRVFKSGKFTEEERHEELTRDRAEMFAPGFVEDFCRSCGWLMPKPRTLKVNRHAGTSYDLKHVAAHEIGYVTNGIFIAAAIACGFKVEQTCPGDLNAYLNISALAKRQPVPEAMRGRAA